MVVFVVQEVDWDCQPVRGVFSTRELAQEFGQREFTSELRFDVIEVELDSIDSLA